MDQKKENGCREKAVDRKGKRKGRRKRLEMVKEKMEWKEEKVIDG